jgi:hypothetical protein
VSRVYLHGNEAFVVRLVVLHGKGAFAVRQPFAMRISPFSKKKSFLFYSFYYLCLFLN